ncbi:surface carbohydrate biosynthesis protein [Qipengyuania oceanensis]|uniref:Surface carbohydrate biosynthesis protein n=1 Tax=Qipengyuania oceanensis TaxID=1463597 RepID=A0A844YDG4_9SPHN|nr:surface carbohydrate biosynthesis protein [Qipengyuania oceanensis]MXO63106.1 hypothetical protein [Qipengyuania oceanensis]
MKVGLIIDHPIRDLPTVSMIAVALGSRGVESYIIPLYDQGLDVPLLGLDAVVTTFLRPANRHVIEAYANMGISVYVLDSEGGVLSNDGPNNPAELARAVGEGGWADLVTGYFFWGPLLHDAFVARGVLPPEKLHLTGCPRFDCASRKWRALLDADGGDFILINTAFPLVNSRFVEGGTDIDAMVSAGWDSDYVNALVADSSTAMREMLGLIAKLASRFPNEEFLVRPHPFENPDVYSHALRDLPNVTVNGEGGVLRVIARSKAVIQLNCSTAIEALMVDKLPMSPDFISSPALRQHSELPNRASMLMQSFEDMAFAIANLDVAMESFDLQERYTSVCYPYFYRIDGDASERIAAVLVRSPRNGSRNLIQSMAGCHQKPKFAQLLQGVGANLLGSRAASRLRAIIQPKRRAKRVSIGEVRHWLNKATTISGRPRLIAKPARHPFTGLPLSSIQVVATKTAGD